MKFTTICLAFATALTFTDCVHGQLLKNLFNNSKQIQLPDFESSTPDGPIGATGLEKFRLPAIPSLFKQQANQPEMTDRVDLEGLSNRILGEQTPTFSPPNILNQFNAKSKQMIDRTTDWARDKQQSLKQNTFGRLTGASNPLGFLNGLSPSTAAAEQPPTNPPAIETAAVETEPQPPAKPNYFAPPRSTQPAQPPIRTASSPDGQPTMRF